MKNNITKEGKVVVVITGANNGIGYYLAKSLLEEGYYVAGLDLECEHLKDLQKSFHDTLLVCQTDVTRDEDIQRAIQSTLQKWNKIDILVNNACLALFSPFDEKSLQEFYKEFEVNYFGYVRMIRLVLPAMKERGRGTIHNVGSGVGITGFNGLTGYSSSKGAIEALSKTLAYELEKYGITVHTIHPPLTNTKSASPLGIPVDAMEDPEKIGRQIACKIQSKKRIITPNILTAFYLFLARRFPDAIGRLMGKMTENKRI
ncbi:SDR family NAD(P)-dependent oxidoreductase [Rhodohalobacter sulfatireducens]|uniref:SDR family NAD(P)-dependent oxidoreductase n=1 Tax=Rhodohalobacter sulfatireducens TaxID=2911366 RepID=A0ABS9KFT4_9BACT|nr:SDR family NAD(P)-dependent oxidoreductase [Rhodohalobacter sulfatireducens]MCG2589724.1 SDR family NAD(P)-dependent oxidoreductase [Rhodohalobacter sulfatireducens]